MSSKKFSIPHPKFNGRRSTGKSYLLTRGEILDVNPKDKSIHSGYFDFKNFVFNPKTDKIGSGAFGDVYLSTNKIDNKKFAIKHIKKSRLNEMKISQNLIEKEIQIQLSLNHPNIVRLFSYFEDSKNYYLILEYVNGGTLFNKIKSQRNFDEKTAFNYFIQITNAINFLHEYNYVHRDIKPENILIQINDEETTNNNINNINSVTGINETCKLCDFGWCRNLEENETRETFCGTYEYMAPEIVREEKYNKEIDVWALGVLLYEMLHGYSPFRAKHRKYENEYFEIFSNIDNLDYSIDKKMSKDCENIIKVLLESDQNKRIGCKDIFIQDWVKKYEKDIKKEIIKREIKKEKEKKKKCEDNFIHEINNKNHVDNYNQDESFNFDEKKYEKFKNINRCRSMKNNNNNNNNENEKININKRENSFLHLNNHNNISFENHHQSNSKSKIKEKIEKKFSLNAKNDQFINNNNIILSDSNNNNYINNQNIPHPIIIKDNSKNNLNSNTDNLFDEVLSKVQKLNKPKSRRCSNKKNLSVLNNNENICKTPNVNKNNYKNRSFVHNEITINHNSYFDEENSIFNQDTTTSSKKSFNNLFDLNQSDVNDTLKMLENAEKIEQKNKKKYNVEKKGFFDNLFKNFQCGSN